MMYTKKSAPKMDRRWFWSDNVETEITMQDSTRHVIVAFWNEYFSLWRSPLVFHFHNVLIWFRGPCRHIEQTVTAELVGLGMWIKVGGLDERLFLWFKVSNSLIMSAVVHVAVSIFSCCGSKQYFQQNKVRGHVAFPRNKKQAKS